MNLDKFLKTFPPDYFVKPIRDKLPSSLPVPLLGLFEKIGAGKYRKGIIEIVDSEEYRPTLETWLGRKAPNYFPLALSAFGDLYYYRKLTDTDEDVCVLSPHYRSINTCVWSLNSFLNEYLTDDEVIKSKLREDLFMKSVNKLGALDVGEIFYFEPALILGGAEELQFVSKGKAKVHLDILFQIG
ncbi:T6SS immunity protein Tdi1 domain-containing protein [Cohnella terricola]|uniref:DUF1851 domain-containing protein n=1 Tax=Cohnella terricola TaxID=1289167 RepID=A0A559J8R9_9BACL|nr:T6SS immunity protein Tdi1 domain-containing protein [Cohnella terricola]TVX96273.1 DUF1851 domain-containing protein [Cohnella terricola]